MSVAIIAGATGLVGSKLLTLLLDDDKFEKVKVLVRRPITIEHPKLETHIVDFDNLGNYREVMSADYAFCCLGTTIKKAGLPFTIMKIKEMMMKIQPMELSI